MASRDGGAHRALQHLWAERMLDRQHRRPDRRRARARGRRSLSAPAGRERASARARRMPESGARRHAGRALHRRRRRRARLPWAAGADRAAFRRRSVRRRPRRAPVSVRRSGALRPRGAPPLSRPHRLPGEGGRHSRRARGDSGGARSASGRRAGSRARGRGATCAQSADRLRDPRKSAGARARGHRHRRRGVRRLPARTAARAHGAGPGRRDGRVSADDEPEGRPPRAAARGQRCGRGRARAVADRNGAARALARTARKRRVRRRRQLLQPRRQLAARDPHQ
ncbi:putative polyketide/nonribosomal protein synthase [Burkholderia pseudomallei]|nr:putative polyketide/nonribosomal protein synthase [Burkholderia pseudomallei]